MGPRFTTLFVHFALILLNVKSKTCAIVQTTFAINIEIHVVAYLELERNTQLPSVD